MYRFSSRRAFTIIELMIVIAIIGILAGVMVPSFMRSRSEAQLSACEQNLKAIATAMHTQSMRHRFSKVPLSPMICDVFNNIDKIDEYVAQHPGGGYQNALSVEVLVDAGHLKSAPICPASGTMSYKITFEGSHANWMIYCSGSNHTSCGLAPDFPKYSAATGLTEN